jgi:hypothetical protein
MELHVAENYYHTLGCCNATCSFHLNALYDILNSWLQIHSRSILDFRLRLFHFLFRPSETIKFHFSIYYRGRFILNIRIPGVPLRSTPGYRDFATMWLNARFALTLSFLSQFFVLPLCSPVFYFISVSFLLVSPISF